ncbi:hypothetical protein [Sandaracinobacteroides hominis]|uniref:hypothetical protein n=1 Tax=Sandaracinobacteroides hominis TaxID=2780086 RepID=UPI0018F42917|nr:hypothetical protein [Sandaracinobacteroides hominis]
MCPIIIEMLNAPATFVQQEELTPIRIGLELEAGTLDLFHPIVLKREERFGQHISKFRYRVSTAECDLHTSPYPRPRKPGLGNIRD